MKNEARSRTELYPGKKNPKHWTSTRELKLEDEASVSTCAGDWEVQLSCPPFRLDRTPLID